MVLDINKILYSCESTFDEIMHETRHGHACRSADTQPNFCRFSSINQTVLNIHTKFINRRWLFGIDHRLNVAPQGIV